MRERIVVLPDPEAPTIAIDSPSLIEKEILSKIFLSLYAKLTCSNAILPFIQLKSFTLSFSIILLLSSR